MSAEDVIAFTLQALLEMNFDTEDAGPDTMLGPSGVDLDSLAISELALRIEDHFGVKFADDDMESVAIMTLGELAAMVAQRLDRVVQTEGAPK